MQDFDLSSLLGRIVALDGHAGRRIVAVVGPPGAGKSTAAEALDTALRARGVRSAVMSMDGFHYDDAVLKARGLYARKGAPETFDVAGLVSLLMRLRRNKESEIAVPVFDRALEISRNAARIIPRHIEVLVVEGNYLLLEAPGWRALEVAFDLTIALDVAPAELRRRLFQRWRDYGIPEAQIPARVEDNDLPNGLTVLNRSRPADITLSQDNLRAVLTAVSEENQNVSKGRLC